MITVSHSFFIHLLAYDSMQFLQLNVYLINQCCIIINNIESTWQMISMVSLYVVCTLALFSYTVYEQLQHSTGYFTAVLSYMSNDMNTLILYNVAVSLAIIFYKILVKIFFSSILQGQVIKITDRLKLKIFDVVLFSYIIGMKLDFQVYLVVVLLIFLYILHNNLAIRSEHLVHAFSASNSLVSHYKVLSLFLILFFFDYQVLKLRATKILSLNEPSEGFLIYYMFETAMIIAEPFLQFIFDFYEKYTITHIKNSQQILAVLGLIVNIPKLTIQLLMSIWIAYKFSQPTFLFISSLNILIQLKDSIQSYSRVRKLTNAMSLLKKLKGQQLQKFHDLTCTVCYDDMKEAVILPCKHIFHEQCMRQWIIKNLNHFCPKCKRAFNFERINEEYHQVDGAIGQKAQLDHFKALFTSKQNDEEESNTSNKINQQNSQIQNRQQEREDYNSLRQTKIKQSQQQFSRMSPQSKKSGVKSKKPTQIPERQIRELQRDMTQYPLQFYEKMRKNVVRVGSLPYGLPTAAVSHRSDQHMSKRRQYSKQIDVVLRLMNMSQNEQLLFL